jgi:hypothetical protein
MFLSVKYRFLFVHIAKTGGTSIRQALKRRCRGDPYQLVQQLCSRASGLTKHRIGAKFPRHAKAVAAKEMLPGDVFENLFKFCVVRNPWDLQVSSFHHVRRERPQLAAKIRDFDHFIEWKFSLERPYHYILDASVEPQWRSVIDLEGNVIMDFIARYETLAADFAHICRRVGFSPPFALPHRRRAENRGDYRLYYSDRSAERVGELYRPDLEAFGYRFDTPPAASGGEPPGDG